MKKYIPFVIVVVCASCAVFLLSRPTVRQEIALHLPSACGDETKVCPAGNIVRRSGPQCQFAQCLDSVVPPDVVSSTEDVVLTVGQKGTVGDLAIVPNEIVSDTRCPVGISCPKPGFVTVNTTLTDGKFTETVDFPSDETHIFDGHEISIASVAPTLQPKKPITINQYRIGFHVEKTATD